jgi:hypothetical protein
MALGVSDERNEDDDDEAELRQSNTGKHRHLPPGHLWQFSSLRH